MPAKIRRGDQVMVLSGKDKGRIGEVSQVYPAKARALVVGVNLVARHTRPTQDSEGGVIRKEMPLALGKLNVVDPEAKDKPTRVGFKRDDEGKLRRFAKRSGAWLDSK